MQVEITRGFFQEFLEDTFREGVDMVEQFGERIGEGMIVS
jgi:hypothetical protein